MFLERLMNQTNVPLLEKLLDFTTTRGNVIAENVANVSTPGYIQKDLDEKKFFGMLRQRVEQNHGAAPGATAFADIPEDLTNPTAGILFHDGNNRSMEEVMALQAKNTMMHNMVVELLRNQYQQMNMALSEKVSERMFESLDTSASALVAQRVRMETIAGNLANMNTTRDADGKPNPYRRRFAVFAPGQSDDPTKAGVHVQSVQQDQGEFRKVQDWGNPDHDAQGYVRYPNIDLTTEMVNAMDATRAYEANVSTMDATKAMFNSDLRLIA